MPYIKLQKEQKYHFASKRVNVSTVAIRNYKQIF